MVTTANTDFGEPVSHPPCVLCQIAIRPGLGTFLLQRKYGLACDNLLSADVVTAEAGGIQMDTLFVDEGFGTLDALALDAVMNVLDELRRGGRTVGVISHLEELRTRIPTRLEVVAGRHGSRLAG